MVEDYFSEQWENKQKGFYVWNHIEKRYTLNSLKKKEEYKWNGSIYPSSLYWSMCVAKHVYSLHKKPFWKTSASGEEKKALGTAWHSIWEDLLKDSIIKAPPPEYPYWIKNILKGKSEDKKHANEVYIYLPFCRLSGWIDLPALKRKKLVVGDFKTTNIPPKDWLEEQVLLPTEKQQTQLYCYAVAVDMLKYYKQKVTGVLLPVYNNYCYGYNDPKMKDYNYPDPRYEWYEDINPIKYQKTLDLMNEIRYQLYRLESRYPEVCNYPLCEYHNDKESKQPDL
jgi:hypothetical protein